MRVPRLLVTVVLLSSGIISRADTLASDTAGGVGLAGPYYLGQSFTVLGSGSFTHVAFNFYVGIDVPVAFGNGYLFSTPYGGTPAGLSSSDPGYLGSAAASGGFYDFGSSVVLAAGDQYFFYEDTVIPRFGVSGGDTGYTGGSAFYTPTATGNFASAPLSQNFDVTGMPTSSVTPEPSSLLLLGTGLLGALGFARRRFA